MNWIPVLSSLIGAAFGAFMGFILQTRNQRLEMRGIINLLIAEIGYLYVRLHNYRAKISYNFSIDDPVGLNINFEVIKRNQSDFKIISNILPQIAKLDNVTLKNTMKVFIDLRLIEYHSTAIGNLAGGLSPIFYKPMFRPFALRWNIYLNELESLIESCEHILEKNISSSFIADDIFLLMKNHLAN